MHEEDRGLSLDFVISIATVLAGSRAADNNLSIESSVDSTFIRK